MINFAKNVERVEKLSLQDLRREYTKAILRKAELSESPLKFFQYWFDQAEHAGLRDANAMVLSTCGVQNMPRARVVLLKQADESGFVFFTNYKSAKGTELAENPNASLLFHWNDLDRQVRIEGKVEKISAQSSDEYFNSRPEGARYGAMSSPQSQVIESRQLLLDRISEFKKAGPATRPEHWGGYRLIAHTYEFWQGRPDRLHDRFLYSKKNDQGWVINRLAP